VLATWPALRDADDRFLGYGIAREGAVTPGDHLQTAYNLWLPGHQLGRAAAPWLDPYSFQPEAPERVNFAGWPFSLVWWPLDLLLDTVGAWNAFVLLSFVGAGGLAALWLRELGLPLGAALVGGLAFALAPYRVAQSTGHLLGPISMLLPLSLWGLERRNAWVAGAAIASIPLSGQVHLALGAIPFFLLYAAVRGRLRLAAPGAVAAVLAGMLVYAVSIRGSIGEDRPFAEVERYSAELGDFVSRGVREFEAFTLVGWLTPLLALAGLAVLLVRRDRLAVALGLGALVPMLLALGANLPGYEQLWRHTPGLRQTRVPERLLPIACLAVAGLVAFAVARFPYRAAPVVAALALAVDLRAGVELFDPLTSDEGNPAYAALRDAPRGRLLELPVVLPDDYAGSVYLYYSMQAPRERPLGYSTTAAPEAVLTARRLRRGLDDELLRELGVRYLIDHGDGKPRDVRTSAGR
jgi:hypothetical protein